MGGSFSLKVQATGVALPVGDDFAEAIATGSIPTSTARDLSGATAETGEPTPSCGRGTGTIWFRYTSTSQKTLTFDTFGSAANTYLAVYRQGAGSGFPSLTEVACNNDHSYPSTDDAAATFLTAPATTTYYFQVSSGSGTSFLMSLREEVAPSNDAFASAKEVTATAFPTYSDEVRTIAATTEAGEPTSSTCGNAAKTVWYRFAPTETTLVRVDTVGSNFDTILYIYSGTALESLGYNGVCNNNLSPGIDFRSRIEFAVQAGTTYYLRAGGDASQGGVLRLNLQGWQIPDNDLFSNAVTITSLPFEAAVTNTYGASREIGEPQPGSANDLTGGKPAYCGNSGRTVWYKYTTSTANAFLSADTFTDSTFNTVVAVYAGPATATVSNLSLVDCSNDHHFKTGRMSSVGFTATDTATTYYFQVGGYYGLSGTLRFRAQSIVDRAPGDPMDDPIPVTMTAGSFTHTNATFSTPTTATVASRDLGEPQPCGGIAATVWYEFTPTTAGEYLATATVADDATFNAVLAVYVKDPLTGEPTQPALQCSQNVVPGPISVSLRANAGVTYLFQVGGYQGDSGSFTITVTAT